jgi:uncharacterized protein (DUF305 family)
MGAHNTMRQVSSSQASRWALGALAVGSAVLVTTAFRAPQTSPATLAPQVGGHYATAPTRAQAEFDQMFIDMMVPHHLGAVEMARVAQSRAEHAEILSMADDIISSQSTEIDQMKAWRQAWYGSGETPPTSAMPMFHEMNGQVMSMGAMNMAQDVETLRAAPEPFDKAFVDAMIPHHQSAIDATQIAQRQAAHQEIKDLATAIIGAQQREIAQMQAWRLAWYGAAESPTVLPDAPMNMPGMGH